MSRSILFVLLSCIFHQSSYCQLKKGEWLAGGSASFKSAHNQSTIGVIMNETDIELNPTMGYFISYKLAAGLKPSFNFVKTSFGQQDTRIGVGPFFRYYFLSSENVLNLFSEARYTYTSAFGKEAGTTRNLHMGGLTAGPVLFFNTTGALEMGFTYSISSINTPHHEVAKELAISIGFQYYFEKE